jgi:hypothetical protein
MVSRRVCCRLGRWLPAALMSRLRLNRTNSACGLSSLLRAAANSIAKGSPVKSTAHLDRVCCVVVGKGEAGLDRPGVLDEQLDSRRSLCRDERRLRWQL